MPKTRWKQSLLMSGLIAGGALAVGATNASADTHVTVNPGESLSQLAQDYDSTPEAIVQANGLGSTNTVLQVGQALDIPNQRPDEWVGGDRSTITKVVANQQQRAQINGQLVDFSKQLQLGNGQVAYGVSGTNYFVDGNGNTYTTGNNGQVTPVAYNNINYHAVSNANQSNSAVTPTQTNWQPSMSASASHRGQQAVNMARSQLGVPYVWGGETPGRGFDCSGLAQWAEGLPAGYRTTYQQQTLGAHHYDIQNAQAGDLYFFGSDQAPYHVAIAEGGGNYIQAPQPGQNVQEGNINWYRPSYYVSMQ